MVIEFNTFGLNQNEGFIIEYNAMNEALCGGELKDYRGTIEMSNDVFLNKNLTLRIGDSVSCLWYINPNSESSKNHTITFTIDKLEFPEPEDANLAQTFKNLQVNDNLGRSLTKNLNRLFKSSSCGNSSVLIGKILGSHDLQQYNHFNLELCGNLTGRNLYYVYAQSGLFMPIVFAHMIITEQPSLMKINYAYNKCGNTYYRYGTFSSPSYGTQNYDNDLVCVYIINILTFGKLLVEFNDFNLEEDNQCNNDYIEILNGFLPDLSPSLGKYCGKNKPKPIITSGSSVTIIFKTNNAINAKGFEFSVKKYKSNQTCGDDIRIANSLQNFISSPFYPKPYKNNMNCIWSIQAEPNYHINIEFTSRFDIEQSTNCTNDYVLFEAKEAENKWRTLNRLCGIKLDTNLLKIQSNHARITFRSNENLTADGFQFKVGRECGRIFNSASAKEGYIISPGQPNYDSSLNCNFIFNMTKNDFIILKLEYFDVNDCPADNLMIIRDKNNHSTLVPPESKLYFIHSHLNTLTYAKNLGPFCGDSKPPNLLTSNEYLKVAFTTDAFKSSLGWKFNYRIIECGRDFNNLDYGEISSPNVEHQTEYSYIHNADCYWNLKVQENYSIVLRFEYLDIEVCGKCHCDYLDILEIEETTTPLAKLCGLSPPIIKSKSNQLRLHFHSDYTGSSSGFRLIFAKAIGEKLGCGKFVSKCQRCFLIYILNILYL